MRSPRFFGLTVLLGKDYERLLSEVAEAKQHEKETLQYLQLIEDSDFKIVPALKDNGHSSVVLKKINSFQQTMSDLVKRLEETRWHDAGIAKFNEILTHSFLNQQDLYDQIVSQLARYLNANQTALFLLSEHGNTDALIRLEACYAYERKKFLEKEFAPGESLVGQAILEKRSIFITNVPQNYTKITSGLGNATPECLLICPLFDETAVIGAMELASFRQFTKIEINFVESLSKIITAAIRNIRQTQQLKLLFKQSEHAQAEIKEKEEELRQQMEELQANNEELSRKSAELERLTIELEEKNKLIAEIQRQERELLESKLETQRKSYEFVIEQLQKRLNQTIHKP